MADHALLLVTDGRLRWSAPSRTGHIPLSGRRGMTNARLQAQQARRHLSAIDEEEGERRSGWQAMSLLRLGQLLVLLDRAHVAKADADLYRATGVVRDDVRIVVDYIRAYYAERFSLAEQVALAAAENTAGGTQPRA